MMTDVTDWVDDAYPIVQYLDDAEWAPGKELAKKLIEVCLRKQPVKFDKIDGIELHLPKDEDNQGECEAQLAINFSLHKDEVKAKKLARERGINEIREIMKDNNIKKDEI